MEQALPMGRWISAISRYHQLFMARRLEHYGIGFGQYSFIMQICSCPGIRQEELADIMYLNKSSVARAVGQLEKAGFILRRTDPGDRRAYCLYATEKAQQVRCEVIHYSAQSTGIMTAGFSDEELDMAARLMERMYHNCVGSAVKLSPKEEV